MNACDAKNGKVLFSHHFPQSCMHICAMHGLRTPNEGINQRYLTKYAWAVPKNLGVGEATSGILSGRP